MALTVTKLNADTTFLLTFTPSIAPSHPSKPINFPGAFTILLDPWLAGHSSILHPTFQISHHTVEPALTSLADVKQPIDLIVISQDKPDHCHRETLCSLSKDQEVNILATPSAAKKIRSWKYFDERKVHVLQPFRAGDEGTAVRIGIPAYSAGKAGGEVTIANITQKWDLTGLHNAIGITYQPPDTVFTLHEQWGRYDRGTTVRLSAKGFTAPPSLARRPRTSSGDLSPTDETKPLRKSLSYPYLPTSSPTSAPAPRPLPAPRADSAVVTPPPNPSPTLSVLYTPHGIPASTLTPYIESHLSPLHALPLLLLLHSTTLEQNPWFLGGTVANGAPGGVEIARVTAARNWISAHDEVKDNRGLATVMLRTRRFDGAEMGRVVEGSGTRVVEVRVGEGVWLEGREGEEGGCDAEIGGQYDSCG